MRKRRRLMQVMMLLAAVMTVISALELFRISKEYKSAEKEYERICQQAVSTKEEASESEAAEWEADVKGIDFDRLRQINPDIVGWISFDAELQIDYPLVQGRDNEKYLETTFGGNKNAAGCLFLDYRNSKDFRDSHTLIYGHNMKNGAMFGRLRNYRNPEFLEAHPWFFIETPEGTKRRYRIFSVRVVDSAEEIYESVSNAEEGVVTLFTCTNASQEERLLVQGVPEENAE